MPSDHSGTALAGVCHIMVTPFLDNEEVDYDSLSRVTQAGIEAGVSALVPLAIMGEAHKLLESERRTIVERIRVDAAGQVALVAGVSADSTYVAVERARMARRAGADYVMMAPPRNATVGPGLRRHYADVAIAAGIPIVVQDEPVTTGVRMPAAFVAELASIDGVVAAKVEESPSPPKISAIREADPDLACFGGLGGISFFEELERGAHGTMTGFGFPRLLVEIFTAYASGDRLRARESFYRYLPIIRFEAQLGVGGVGVRKRLFAERGIISHAGERRPSHPVDEATARELRELMSFLGLTGRDR